MNKLPHFRLNCSHFKTLFLLGLALASRVSGLHALSGLAKDIVLDRNSVTLHFVPKFRAKTQQSYCSHEPRLVPRLHFELQGSGLFVFGPLSAGLPD